MQHVCDAGTVLMPPMSPAVGGVVRFLPLARNPPPSLPGPALPQPTRNPQPQPRNPPECLVEDLDEKGNPKAPGTPSNPSVGDKNYLMIRIRHKDPRGVAVKDHNAILMRAGGWVGGGRSAGYHRGKCVLRAGGWVGGWGAQRRLPWGGGEGVGRACAHWGWLVMGWSRPGEDFDAGACHHQGLAC